MSTVPDAVPRVLVVDDQRENLDLLGVLLRGHGIAVDAARHGEEALAQARLARPDLVISDLLMPVMDGFSLLRHWRADASLREIPFVVYTATYTDPQDEDVARQLGADDFLIKPAEPAALLERVRTWLARGRSSAADLAPPAEPAEDQLVAYNSALVRKLEDKMEEALTARRLLERVLENLPEVIVLYDRELRIRYINGAARALTGLAPEQFVGRHCEDVVSPEVHRLYHPLLEETLATGQVRTTTAAVEFEGPRKRWIHITCLPLADAAGATQEVIGITQDRTELMERQEELRSAQERLRRAARDGRIVLWEWDLRTRSGWLSEEGGRLLGYEPGELTDTIDLLHDRLHPDDLGCVLEKTRSFVAGRAPVDEAEFRLRHRDGRYRRVLARAALECDADGAAILVRGTLMDVTERSLLQEQLFGAQKLAAIGQLAGGVAHDFNNLLTVILGNASLLEARLRVRGDVAEELGHILHASERAAQLTRQLLLLSRKAVIQVQPVDLNELARGLMRLVSRLMGEDVDLRTRFEPNLPRVQADPGMLEQVLLNLLNNARDAMPGGGTLEVATELVPVSPQQAASAPGARAGVWVALSVRDSGTGISPEVRPHLFEPLFTTKASGKGTGLGLAIVRDVAQRHGGWVEVRSEPGAGAEFRVLLPPIAGAVAPADAQSARPPLPSGTERVLVVEDDAPLRQLIAGVLSERGFAVTTAAHAEAAEQALRSAPAPFDLLVADAVLPGPCGGVELAERSAREHPGLRVLITSGYPAEQVQRLQDALGWVRFLRKPFMPFELLEAVRKTLDSGR